MDSLTIVLLPAEFALWCNPTSEGALFYSLIRVMAIDLIADFDLVSVEVCFGDLTLATIRRDSHAREQH